MAITSEQKKELAEIQNLTFKTKRATVPALEEILFEPINILDHGFIRVVDYMGDDNAIVQSARVSYGKGTKQVNQDKGLINYLMRHWHTTPFEMCEIKFHIKLPIFIARQWIRHRTANVNEYSARYSIMDKEFYIPSPENLAPQSKQNHQGRAEGEPLTGDEAKRVLELLKRDSLQCYDDYEEMLNHDAAGNIKDENRRGLARELARMNLTLNYYTQWYWKIDLHNLMHFLMLRADSHAQYEIRAYADAMIDVVKRWCPFAYEAFSEYRMGASHLSKTATEIVKRALKGEKITQENSGLGKREWEEFAAKFLG
ncbi:MAG: FAD-dependent thymidylate synthase [Rickettsiales bacterium]|nr:FAD-dependent thymidylate synthase [Rickettsiales bacterium]